MRRFSPRTALTGSFLSSGTVNSGRTALAKQVQRGTFTQSAGVATGTATISAVVLVNTIHSYLGYTSDNGTHGFGDFIGGHIGRLDLTNTTTLTSNFTTTSDGDINTISYEVMEFQPGVLQNCQRGTISVVATGTSATGTITAVDTTKSILLQQGWGTPSYSWASAAGLLQSQAVKSVLTNGTTVTTTVTNTGGATTGAMMGYTVSTWY